MGAKEPSRRSDLGSAKAQIARSIVRLHNEYYGRGPSKARTYIDENLIAVVLEEVFTPAEHTLIERGEASAIKDIRRRFQQIMEEEFRSIVEQVTGRKVVSFMSETDVNSDISVELFLLGEARTDMSDFEEEGEKDA